MTASSLFAHDDGDYRCYYCGGKCSGKYSTDDFVKDTFTNRDIVKYPQSKHVCIGCVESLGNGEDEMPMIDGTIKTRTNARGMCPRMYSWVLTKEKRLAGTKAHIKEFREIILNPPDPPFSIVLSDSGQKQIIFRSPVAMNTDIFQVMLEDEIIEVSKDILAERLAMCKPVCAALGKPALLGELSFSSWATYEQYHGEIETLEKWQNVKSQPISRLAAWLSISREEAQNEYPSIECGKVPSRAGGISGQEQGASRNGAGSDKGRSGQVLFNFS